MADPFSDTASQRPATGLDVSARSLILSVFDQADDRAIMIRFFQDHFADFQDYMNAVTAVWGADVGSELAARLVNARDEAELAIPRGDGFMAMCNLALRCMPEPDFRRAIKEAFATARYMDRAEADRISSICRSRGIPWRFDRGDGFVWVGDQEVEERAVAPAMSALGDPRFSGGVRVEFESACAELAEGTPQALSKSVHQAGVSVESALKVVLQQRDIRLDAEKDTATALFEHLKAAGVVEEYMRSIVLGPATHAIAVVATAPARTRTTSLPRSPRRCSPPPQSPSPSWPSCFPAANPRLSVASGRGLSDRRR